MYSAKRWDVQSNAHEAHLVVEAVYAHSLIHPWGNISQYGRTDSVKINTSLLMMRECEMLNTRSLGALWAPTSRLRPFGPA